MLTSSRTDPKTRSRRPFEYEILKKSRSPHDDFLKNKESFFPFLQKLSVYPVNNLLILNIWLVFNSTYIHDLFALNS
jgi:hypothetical protein